ncbi:hypothetical protein [Aeromicrobium sp. UC242_57]|uniref:hypothetical protein n=1 Tax=Aeromicrobium sp. UC242_57 TaxID=3374624 RepID=UPI003798339C
MSEYEDDQLVAIQNVVDRVSAYQDGATQETVLAQLREGFDEVAVEVSTDDVATLAEAIYDNDGDVSAAEVIG